MIPSTDTLIQIAGGVALVALTLLSAAVCVYSVEEIIRRIRHFDTKAPPRPVIRAKFLGQEIELEEAAKGLTETVEQHQQAIEAIQRQLVRLSLRAIQLERQLKGGR